MIIVHLNTINNSWFTPTFVHKAGNLCGNKMNDRSNTLLAILQITTWNALNESQICQPLDHGNILITTHNTYGNKALDCLCQVPHYF